MTIRRIFRWALPVCFAAGLVQAQVGTPRVGAVRYADGSVWTLNGLRANFILGARLFTSVETATFSDSGGLVAIPGEVDLVRLDGSVVARYQTDEQQPTLDISGDLTSATIWLPSKHALLHWNGSAFVATEGAVPDPAAFHQKIFTLFSDARGFEIQAADGTVRTLAISAPDIKIERMSGDWLHLSSATAHRDWALLLTQSDLQLSELPEPGQ